MHKKINDWRPYMYAAIMLVLIFFGTGFIFSKLLSNYLYDQMIKEATTMAELNRYSISTINQTMDRLEDFIEDRLNMVADVIVETGNYDIVDDYDLGNVEIFSDQGIVIRSDDKSRIGQQMERKHAVFLLIQNNVDSFFDRNHGDISEDKHFMNFYKKLPNDHILSLSVDVKNIYDFTQFDSYIDEVFRDDRILSILIYLSEDNENRIYGSGKSSYHLTSDQWESIVKRRTHYKNTMYDEHYALEVHVPIEKDNKVIGSYFIVYSLDNMERFMSIVSFIIAGVLFLITLVMYGLLRAIISRNQKIEDLSYRDESTNIMNRKYLKELHNQDQLDPSKRIVVFFIRNLKRMELLIDAKQIEDMVKDFVEILRNISNDESIFRYSEESFVLLCDDIDLDEVFDQVNPELDISAGYVSRINYGHNFFHSIDIANVILENTIDTKHVILEKEVQEEIIYLQRIEQDLRNLDNVGFGKEMFVLFQPQIDAITEKVVVFEALTRWNHPELGFVDPQLIFKTAVKNDFFFSLNQWVFEEVLKFIKSMGDFRVVVSVNASTRLLESPGFIERLEVLLLDYDVKPNYLSIEITETEIVDEFTVLEDRLKKLNRLGIKIYIDDYGSGYSTLTRLKRLKVDALKIDKSFVDDIGIDNRFAESILDIADNLNLDTVAEGVETKEQLDWLVAHGCTYIQGYYYSKPLEPKQALKYLEERRLKND